MSISIKSLGLDRLSITERLQLVEELWESLVVTPDEVPVTAAQRNDLEHRLAAFQDDPQAGDSWEQVQARLRGQ